MSKLFKPQAGFRKPVPYVGSFAHKRMLTWQPDVFIGTRNAFYSEWAINERYKTLLKGWADEQKEGSENYWARVTKRPVCSSI